MVAGGQTRKGENPQSVEHAFQESDEVIVPEKSAKTWVTPVESMEGRTEAKGKSVARNALSAQDEVGALTYCGRSGEEPRTSPRNS